MRNARLLVVALGVFCIGASARAQEARDQAGPILRTVVRFLSPVGYFPTGSLARSAFGSSKWAGETSVHVRPKRIGGILLSGGFDRISASTHFLPFTGGNSFSLTGAGGRVTTPRVATGIRPFATAGLYACMLRCDSLGISTTRFTPSGSVGAEWRPNRSVSLSASYRIARPVAGLSMDGFGLYLKLF